MTVTIQVGRPNHRFFLMNLKAELSTRSYSESVCPSGPRADLCGTLPTRVYDVFFFMSPTFTSRLFHSTLGKIFLLLDLQGGSIPTTARSYCLDCSN